MNSTSGGSRLRAPTSATCFASTAPSSSTIRSGMPHAFPDGERRGRVQVAVRVDPDDRQALLAGGERLDRADVRAAAAAEDDRPVGQLGGEHQRLLRERVGLDHARLRVGQLVEGRLGHRLAAVAPGARDADEAGAELAAARVALVLRADRDRGQRAAVGTAGAEAAHAGEPTLGRAARGRPCRGRRSSRRARTAGSRRSRSTRRRRASPRVAPPAELGEGVQEQRLAEALPPPGPADAEHARRTRRSGRRGPAGRSRSRRARRSAKARNQSDGSYEGLSTCQCAHSSKVSS